MARPPVGPQKPPLADGPVNPTRGTANRWSEATQYYERFFRSRNAPQRRGMDTWEAAFRLAKTTTSVGPRSGSTYGTGTIKFQEDTGSALADDGTDTYTVKNITNKTVASGAFLIVGWVAGSWWVVVPDTCSHLS